MIRLLAPLALLAPLTLIARRTAPRLAVAAATVGLLVGAPVPALAHGPDPRFGGALWAQDQRVTYTWRSGQVPPDWMAAAIDTAASDASSSRRSRAATFARASGAASLIAYGEPTGCSSAGIACFDRSGAPASFRMWFRAHGYRFDWGTLLWCQAPSSLVNGCFDVETIGLDELGHVEVLDHHVNYGDASDYLDAVVQAVSRARPSSGWSQHAFGRCDAARLQLEYDRISTWDSVSTCLSIPTVASLSSDSLDVAKGDYVTFTASLRTSTDSTSYRALAGDPLSGRTIYLQSRAAGTSTWTTVVRFTASSTVSGTYTARVAPSATADWRAWFPTPSGDGVLSSVSGALSIGVYQCPIRAMCPTV